MSNDRQLPSDGEIVDEIRSQNELRAKVGLPPLELEREIDRVHEFRERQEFERWMYSPLRYRIQQKLLRRIRGRINNPDWQPTGFCLEAGLHSMSCSENKFEN
jgi:hypothetical protein